MISYCVSFHFLDSIGDQISEQLIVLLSRLLNSVFFHLNIHVSNRPDFLEDLLIIVLLHLLNPTQVGYLIYESLVVPLVRQQCMHEESHLVLLNPVGLRLLYFRKQVIHFVIREEFAH